MLKNIQFIVILLGVSLSISVYAQSDVKHVILISVDGLNVQALTRLPTDQLPNLNRLMKEGASTLNARTDPDYTLTLPNHTSMLTSRPVNGAQGHSITFNDESKVTIHQVHGSYVPSIFDRLREHHRVSVMASSKEKFSLYADSYPIDQVLVADGNDQSIMQFSRRALQDFNPSFVFLHIGGLDRAGHKYGWNLEVNSPYLEELRRIDHDIGDLLRVIESSSNTLNETVIILTSDHGGTGRHHQDNANKENYIIPMIIWGKSIAAGGDLYKMNLGRRSDPGDKQIATGVTKTQPIRNGDAANIALQLLGLPCVKDSMLGCEPLLNVYREE